MWNKRKQRFEAITARCMSCGGDGWRTYVRNGAEVVVDEMCAECDGTGRIVIRRAEPRRMRILTAAIFLAVLAAILAAEIWMR